MTYENILVETRGRVGLVTLNRPKALHALNRGIELGRGEEAVNACRASAASGPAGISTLGVDANAVKSEPSRRT